MDEILAAIVVGVFFFAILLILGSIIAAVLFTRMRQMQQQFDAFRKASHLRLQELEKQLRQRSAEQSVAAPASQQVTPTQTVASGTAAASQAPPAPMTPAAPAPQPVTLPSPIGLEPAANRPAAPSPAAASSQPAMSSASTRAAGIELEENKVSQPQVSPPPRTSSSPVQAKAKADDTVEAHLGGKMFVWIGAVAIALAGVFLVKYSFDNNLLSPRVRLILGVILGAALLVAGEFMRLRSRGIGQAATGAGIAVFYACILAAVNLYELISPTAGFITMIVVTAAAVGLSLRQGQGVAILGLLGGFSMPVMLGGRFESAVPILTYLFLLQAALVFLARSKAWSNVLILSALGGSIWATILSFIVYRPADRMALQVFVLMCFGLFLAGTWSRITAQLLEPEHAGKARMSRSWNLADFLGRGAMVLMVILAFRSDFGAMDLLMVGVMSAGLLILTRIRPVFQGLYIFAGVITTLLLAYMAVNQLSPSSEFNVTWERALWGLGSLFAIGSYLAMWGSRREQFWAISCSAAGVLLVLVGLSGYGQMRGPGVFGIEGLAMWKLIAPIGGLYILAAVPWWMKRSQSTQAQWALEAFVLTSFIMFTLASWYAFEFHNHLLAWAGLVLLAAIVSQGLRLISTAGYALCMSWLMLGLLLVVVPVQIEYGPRVVLNYIAQIYGGVALLVGLAAWLMKQERLRSMRLLMQFVSLLTGTLGVLWLIRHGFHPTDILSTPPHLREWATGVIAMLVIMHGLLVWDRRLSNWPCMGLAAGLLVVSLLAIGFQLCLRLNPLWSHQPVGDWPVLNWLLFIYGLPAVLLILLQWTGRHRPALKLHSAGGIASLVLIFGLVTLEVRQFFHGDYLDGGDRTMAELYSYSVAWIVLGITLLILGVKLGSRSLRYASLMVMVLAIGKVFLVDTSQLKNLYRVLSLLGLGLSLMGLGYFYQRFVFSRSGAKGDIAAEQAQSSPAENPDTPVS